MKYCGQFFAFVVALHACTATAEQPTTRPVPDPAAQARAEKLIRELYRREFSASAPALRRPLARKLLDQAGQNSNDPATDFILLRHARDIAALAGDASTAARAIRRTHQLFGGPTTPAMLTAMQSAIRAAENQRNCASAARICTSAADEAIAEDDHESARKLLTLATTAARRAADPALTDKADLHAKELITIAADYAKIPAAKSSLENNPDDSKANLLVGRYLCLIKSDWAAGLPLLAKSEDPALAPAAKDDLAQPLDAAKMMEAGDLWWAAAQMNVALARRNLRARAVHWYRQSLGGLEGLKRSVIAKRIEEFDQERFADMDLSPGLSAQLYRGANFEQPAKSRIDPQIDFDWGMNAPDDALPKDNFSIRWNGTLNIHTAGRYDFTIIANGGAKLWIDGKLAVDGSSASRSRNGVHAAVDLSEGLHPIRIDYWDTTGIARMRLLWQPPGSSTKEVIPPTAFYHEQ